MKTVYFDIETADADELYTYGPDFCRLAGYAVNDGPVTLTTDMDELCDVLMSAARIVAHNAIGFDLAALEHWHGLDVGRLVAEGLVRDTLLMARHNDPPLAEHGDGNGYFKLDSIGHRLGLGGKAVAKGRSMLDVLAKEFGGYDRIPTDEPRYRDYLVRDVELLRNVYGSRWADGSRFLKYDEYLRREHQVMWRLQHISRHGFRVDTDEVGRRLAEQADRMAEMRRHLIDDYGMPEKGTKPWSSKPGKAVIEKVLADCGVAPPRTPTGGVATGQEVLERIAEEHSDKPRMTDLCRLILAANGERSMAQTIKDCTRSDGRVHPGVSAEQATGRISTSKPGLTVIGKRKRKNILERSFLLADEGCVLICFDLSQIDIRAMSARAQDQNHLALMRPDNDLDFHQRMAVQLFGDASRREDAKGSAHAINYGQSARNLAAQIGVATHEAEMILARIDQQFPMLAQLKERQRQLAQAGFIHNAFGRPLRVTPGREYTQGSAHTGQGDARDLMMEGILRLPTWLLPCLRAIVHDEIVLSVPEARADEAEEAVMKALQFEYRINPDDQPVPILADKSERGRDWADCYRLEKSKWPEVAWAHRQLDDCDDAECIWHRPASPLPLTKSGDEEVVD